MSVTIQSNTHSELVFTDELTIYTAAETMETIRPELKKMLPIRLNLSEVAEIDAAGLQILLAIKSHAASANQELTIDGQSDAVMELLALGDLAGHFGEPVVFSAAAI